jgi:hypothetical protein
MGANVVVWIQGQELLAYRDGKAAWALSTETPTRCIQLIVPISHVLEIDETAGGSKTSMRIQLR